MISRLPEDKLVNLRQLLAKTVHRRKVHLKELQSLIGSLNFACQVVTPGRAFLRRLIDLTCHVSDPFEEIDFTSEERADIKAWQLFIDNFNGKSIFHLLSFIKMNGSLHISYICTLMLRVPWAMQQSMGQNGLLNFG